MDEATFKTDTVKSIPRNPYSPPQSLTSPKTWLQLAVNKIKKCNKHCQFAQVLRAKSQEYRRVRCAEVDSWNKTVLVELLQQCIAELEAFQVTLIDRLYDVGQDMAADLQEAVDLEKSIIEHEVHPPPHDSTLSGGASTLMPPPWSSGMAQPRALAGCR